MTVDIGPHNKFVALGGTFHSHLAETDRTYRWPDIWVVPGSSVISEGEPIQIPERVEEVKPGAELTAVIGEELWEASDEEAWDAIDGFTVSNDVTASGEWPGQSEPDGLLTGVGYKIFRTFSPILTEVQPKRELEFYADLDVEAEVDGEISVSGSTELMAFSIPEMVAFASRVIKLTPGDVVALGDPGQTSIFLDDAESVTCRIEGIGELTNPIEHL